MSGTQRPLSIGSSAATAGTLRLTGATINSVGNVILRNSGTGSLTISSNVSTGTGPMALDLGNSTDNVIRIDNSGAITISATVTGASRTLTLSGSGSGALTLSASNTYTGTTQLTSGILRAGNDGAFSSSLLLLNGGTLSSDSATARSFSNNVRLGGNVAFGDGAGTGALSFGSLDLGGTDRTVTTVVSTTFAGAVTNGSLTKTGAATLSLNNSGNSFGTLTINAGTASIGANTAITGLAGSGGGLNLAAGTLTVTQASSGTYAGVLSGAGSLTKAGAGALTLAGNSSGYTGTTTVSDGTLVANGNLGGSASISNGGTLELGAAQTFAALSGNGTLAAGSSAVTLNITGTSTFGGTLTGNAASTLTKTGAGTMNFTGTTSGYAGAVTVNAGVITGLTSFGSGTVTMNAGSAYGEAGGTIGNDFAIGLAGQSSGSFSGYWNFGTSSGTYAVTTVTGAGVTFGDVSRGNNAFSVTSPSNSSASTGYAGASGDFNAAAGALAGAYASGSSTYFEFTVTGTGGYTFDVDSVSFGSRSTSSGPSTLSLVSTADLNSFLATAASATNSNWALQTLVVPGTSAAGATTYRIYGYNGSSAASNWRIDDLTVSGSSFLSSIAPATAALGINEAGATTFSGNVAITGTAQLVAVTGGTARFSGVISGGAASALVKTGSGRVILEGVNTFTGATSVTEGLLQIDGVLSSNVLVAADAAARLGGNGTINGAVTIGDGAILAPGASTGEIEIATLTWANGGVLHFEINDANGVAGSPSLGWDLTTTSTSFTFDATSGDPFMINLITLGTNQFAGQMVNFDANEQYAWLMLQTTGSIGYTSVDANRFQIVTTNFQNAFGGSFFVARGDETVAVYGAIGGSNSQLYLVYVPEPSACVLAGLGLAAAGWAARRRRLAAVTRAA